ncbi:hypothetical protein GUITHDRAFT_150118 [Guillardia theta CCMP2712]|uniref:Autophagy-related protein 27 n=1 Tax=Guillardia theta (strain CCMP2712) TaxID=905079 RepID=L1K045_GUITC|nr:hypothetical protein GUITHDRAFT_150118 [Guillardia theta CCMP2712]EKX53992.1 hypothetical protein GUITHDRAFT_150118 [Guillardia theta CCMP2712]|eukprot:XP_005840972.1 hypothetical protein GUITHDRAFT_150118 [Guillardia theta CCMP2712]
MPSWILLTAVLLLESQSALADIAECTHTFPDGNKFDLSPLRRPRGVRDWYADDRNGNMYYFNVCGDANQVPEACVSMQKAVRSPVFQVSNDNNCFWLGKLKGMDWELIDDSEPAAGIELYYFDGERCQSGRSRDVRIQFFCDPDAGVGKPLDFFVLEEDCHFSITWPSKYGCPVSSGSFTSSWFTVFLILFTVYTVAGCAYNVKYRGTQIGIESMPNLNFWKEVLSGLYNMLILVKNKVGQMIGRKSSEYQRFGGH